MPYNGRGRPRGDPADRFWAKVDKAAGPNGCWLFTSTAERKGYGVFWLDGKVRYAHRVSWLLAGHELRDDLVIDHICRTLKCVNPSHLRLVTTGDNVLAGVAQPAVNARKRHCTKCGAPYSPENTAFKEVWSGKTRHGHPRSSPIRSRICITCHPTFWRFAMVKREPPPGYKPRKSKWVGPYYGPKRDD